VTRQRGEFIIVSKKEELAPAIRLKPENYGVVEKLLNKMDMFLQVEAIITGKAVGDVFVDGLNEPSFALVWDYGHNLAHATLFQSLRRNADILDYYLHYHPLALEDELTKGLRGKYPRKIFRNHYFFMNLVISRPQATIIKKPLPV
jgi:hypothetical protein